MRVAAGAGSGRLAGPVLWYRRRCLPGADGPFRP